MTLSICNLKAVVQILPRKEAGVMTGLPYGFSSSAHALVLPCASLYHGADHAGPWSLLFLSPPPDSQLSKGRRHSSSCGLIQPGGLNTAEEIILMDLAVWR